MVSLTNDELLTTTRSVRKRLDLHRPVEREIVEECLRLAFQAPNGSNNQSWNWILVDDTDRKAEMATLYRQGLADHLAGPYARGADAPIAAGAERISASVQYLVERLEAVPVLMVPTIAGRVDAAPVFYQASIWGSILPAAWSFMLALRTRGLASAWTTLHLYREKEMAALLGIPYDEVTQAGLFPVAYSVGDQFKPADRTGSAHTIHWNGWS